MKKKRLLAIICTLVMIFTLSGCGESSNGTDAASSNESGASTQNAKQKKEAQPPDLTGEWKQVNSNSDDSYQTAVIQNDTIEVYWVDTSSDSNALYWAGSYTAPTTTNEPYSWDSTNDKSKTDSALMASGDDTKTFTYSDGQISYSVSALGVTQTVKLEKQ